ncbi:hypothetical protein CC78DRAFT_530372 [Lojkania enalia]|uniref:Seipin n=1 Tax=Lojkania enalia TaxID=147567 RepID=A0A9P4KG41_9PLEO|nr:hypothetical protein CC78DRAFT_530372 [Didymosphaeria enalia]
MEDTEEDFKERRTISQYITDKLLAPIRIILSPALLRTYLRTALILLTSSILFAIAVIAYTWFYYSYIPVRGISVPVYLQFSPAHAQPGVLDHIHETHMKPPYGIANVAGLVSRQKYDVVVTIDVPRSQRNLELGNWMVGIEMRGPGVAGGGVKKFLGFGEEWDVDDFSYGPESGRVREVRSGEQQEKPVVLARSRRPALLTFRSWMTETVYRGLRLPVYVLGWGDERERVVVRMMEGVQFDKGWRNVPASLRLEVRSKLPLEVYQVSVRFTAQLEGLRWVMHHYRLTSFAIFTSAFWGVEMTLVLLTWGFFTLVFGTMREVRPEEEIKVEPETIKTEPESSAPLTPLSDTSRTFPTLPSQRPLHYSSAEGARVKDECPTPKLEDIPPHTEAEADDEDEDADFIVEEPVPNSAANILTDSGIGTSMESSREGDRGLVRRRSGGNKDG